MKNMVGCLFALGFLGLFGYLIWKNWDIFGFWRLLACGFFNLFLLLVCDWLSYSRKEKDNVVTYNPMEAPQYIGIVLLGGTVTYLFMYLQSLSNISSYDYNFGLFFLGIQVINIVRALTITIRDRNDFIQLSPEGLSYKDNAKEVSFPWVNIKSISFGDARSPGYSVILKGGEKSIIDTPNMNFATKNVIKCLAEIQEYLEKYKAEKQTDEQGED